MNVTPQLCASSTHYAGKPGRRVRAPGLHVPHRVDIRTVVGRVPSPGGFESVVMKIASCAALALLISASGYSEDLGLFDNQMDVGKVSHAGSTSFDAASRSYSIAGGGENMWFTNDAFHFVWTRVSGDFALQAAIEWLGAGGNPHKKACLIARQSLAPDAPYVDVAVHGDGLVSLQYRELPAGPTREIQAIVGQTPRLPAARLALERQGELFFISTIAATDGSPASGVTHPPTLQPS